MITHLFLLFKGDNIVPSQDKHYITNNNFSLKHIAESGQCFRMYRLEENIYEMIAFGKYLVLKQIDEVTIEFSCTYEEYESLWKAYFDIDTKYCEIITNLKNLNNSYLTDACDFGSGIRILKQDKWETLVSFIISQRKNIPAIQKSIETMSELMGNKIYTGRGFYVYSFPTAEQILNNKDKLSKCSLGYREEYIYQVAKSVVSGELDLDLLSNMSSEYIITNLLKIYGVGIKVASCVALFAYHKLEIFPIDVWIQRIENTYYNGHFPVELCQQYAGVAQQYMFYYERYRNNI